MDMREPSGTRMQRIGLIAGPVLAILLLLFFDLEPGRPAVTRTAAVALMMMVPIVLAVVLKLEEATARGRLATGLFLGVAYSASIGGAATLVGTPPNLSFASCSERTAFG